MADLRGAYLGTGKIYLEDLDTPKGLIHIGNCNSFGYEAETEEIEEQDYTTPGGGLDASVLRIKSLNITYNARHFKAQNIARAVYGISTDAVAGTVTEEAHTVYRGALVDLKYPGASAIVITPAAGGAALVLDTDYIINAAGYPEILETSATVTGAGLAVKVAYSYSAHASVQALVASGKRFRLKFLGLNEVRSGKPMVIEVYRVNHSPASMSLIGDEFQGMEFTAKAEKDQTVQGTGLSQYMVIQDVA
jgi:hypothetical protein